jgi:hypothetical protein
MKIKILSLFLFIFLISCNRDDNSIDTKSSIELSILNFTATSISLDYNIKNISGEKYLIYSKSENFDLQNCEKKIVLNNSNNIQVSDLTSNTKYFFKISYTENNTIKYSDVISAITKEISFSNILDKDIGLTPENGSFIYLMDSELDESKSFLFLLTRQIKQYSGVKKIELHKIDLNVNLIWSKLIQDSPSPYTYKIQLLSDHNIAVITGTGNQKATIITKINPNNGDLIWQKEYPVIDLNGVQGNLILGYKYQNNLIKIITGGGYEIEELWVNNEGGIILHKTLKTNNIVFNRMTYSEDGSVFDIYNGDKIKTDALVTYDGLIQKITINDDVCNKLYEKYYGDYGGDDSFENFLLKENNIYVQGFYGGTSGFTDKQKWVLKLDLNGEILWQNKQPSRKDFIYQGRDIKINENNELFCLMHEIYYPNYNAYDYTSLTKFNNNGNLIWTWKSADDFNNERFSSNKVFETNKNEFMITGWKSPGVGSIWIKKIKVNE